MSNEELVLKIAYNFNLTDKVGQLSVNEMWNPIEDKKNSSVWVLFHYEGKRDGVRIASCDVISMDREFFYTSILMQLIQGKIEQACKKDDFPKPYLSMRDLMDDI